MSLKGGMTENYGRVTRISVSKSTVSFGKCDRWLADDLLSTFLLNTVITKKNLEFVEYI